MILEAAYLDVKSGQKSAFEAAFGEAKSIISSMPGFVALELQRCIETQNHGHEPTAVAASETRRSADYTPQGTE